jgi:hypothetical protein
VDPPLFREALGGLLVRLSGRESQCVAVGEQALRDREPDALVRGGDERDARRC